MRYLFWLAIVGVVTVSTSWGESVRLAEDLTIDVTLPASRWEMSSAPAQALLDETVEHLHHELEGKGKDLSGDAIKQLAVKRLAVNELFLRSESGAHIEIDVSPLNSGEEGPSARGVEKSAEYAGQSMESEEGVEDAAAHVKKVDLQGVSYVFRLDLDYKLHGQKMKFVGLIGFEDPYWLYFYATNPLNDDRDTEEIEAILQSLKVVVDESR